MNTPHSQPDWEPLRFQGLPWRVYRRALIPDAPPHACNHLTTTPGSGRLLAASGALMMHWTTDFDRVEESPFWYVIKDTPARLEDLSSNTRSKVRRGLKRCRIEPADGEVVSGEGYPVYRSAFARYKDSPTPKTEEEFRDEIRRNVAQGNWEFWTARDKDGRLIAYSMNRIMDGTVNYATVKFDPAHLGDYSSYALFFAMNEHYLGESGFSYVNDGARSISHETNVQSFLMGKFGFRKAYCLLHVRYRPWLGLAVRLLYPLRPVARRLPTRLGRDLASLLKIETIARACADPER